MGGVQTDVKLGPQESSGFRCCPDSDRNSASQPAAGWVTNTSLQQRILTLEMANYGAGAKPSMVRKSDRHSLHVCNTVAESVSVEGLDCKTALPTKPDYRLAGPFQEGLDDPHSRVKHTL